MTFDHSRTATSTASAEAVWALWSDPATWADWDPAVVAVALDGPFVAGTAGVMTLTGPVELPVTLEQVEEGHRYLDQLTMGDLVIRIDHVVTAGADGGCEVTVSTTIEGPGAEDIGPMVTNDAPLAMARLIELAEGV